MSNLLRVHLLPPRFRLAKRKESHTTSGWAPITPRQVSTTPTGYPVRWSIATNMAEQLIEAVSGDLDEEFKRAQTLSQPFEEVIADLQKSWNRDFGPRSKADYTAGLEDGPVAASKLLLIAAASILDAVGDATGHAPLTQWQQEYYLASCKMDNLLKSGDVVIVGDENKPATDLPQVLCSLGKRADLGSFKVEISPLSGQPKWWLVVNKGALYATVYKINWILFSGLTTFCVGYRQGDHMYWSAPLPNRRDAGDEFENETPETTKTVFGDNVHPGSQHDLLLLYVAVTARGAADKGIAWVQQAFPRLCNLQFKPPSEYEAPKPKPDCENPNAENQGFDSTGRDDIEREDPGPNDADDDNSAGGNSSDSSYSQSTSDSSNSSQIGQTVVMSGEHSLTGTWRGLLQQQGYTILIQDLLSDRYQCSVYGAELCQFGQTVSKVVVKMSTEPTALEKEYKAYSVLNKSMHGSIPTCYGLCMGANFTCLVTDWVSGQMRFNSLTRPERGAVYALVRRLHEAGWSHNDLVDPDCIRNILWNSDNRPMLIDLETARHHKCLGRGRCSELMQTQKVLKLSNYHVSIYARECVSQLRPL
ncbi:hypothetical protein R3P38DRAFT_2656110 [Favolaschia claudopus]|uniref:Protein kinase domain-containing protein n=1 Tax=Favolaschia claudopus TaxID=2862362 RepID=A0AAV9ZWD4_9AGAR